MTLPVYIEAGSGTRRVRDDDFPLTLGGIDADVPLPGVANPEPVALIGTAEGGIFIQSQGLEPVVCNGTPISTSQWLHDDDVVRIGNNRIRVRLEPERTRLILEGEPADHVTEPARIVSERPASASDAAGHKMIRPVEFKPGVLAGGSRKRRRVRPSVVVLWIAVPLLAVVAWFVLTARAVEIVVEPLPEEVRVEGRGFGFPLELGGRHLLRPGTYELAATKEGYHPLVTDFDVTTERNQTLEFTMRALDGFLAIDTVEGVAVAVDGVSVGVTPLPGLALAPGVHEVEITSERYRTWADTVAIEGRGLTETLNAELLPRWAAVTFDSVPPGARVIADGSILGKTPLTIDLIEGRYRIGFELQGYKTRHRTVEVVAGEPQSVTPVRLDLVDGRLVVLSSPPGATVTVNDVYHGETPLDLYLSPDDRIDVAVAKVGYDAEKRTVGVAPGKTRTVEVTLEPILGEISIRAEPRGAELFVDGKPLGDANQTLRLVAVPHEIIVRADGYEPHRVTVLPRPAVGQSLDIRLRTPEQIKTESRPRVIRTKHGQELVLIEGGRFTMGASRREPGRRANETLREVELTRPFYLATREISNDAFREFRSEHLSGAVEEFNLENDHHPVVRVTWEDAALFCNWLSKEESLPAFYERRGGRMVPVQPPNTGYRLPTEAEWAFAARYSAGETPLKYPWGDSLPVEPGSGNYADQSARELLEHSIPGFNDGYPTTAPIESFTPNGLGLFNLGGNVAEWMHDIYTIYSRTATVAKDPAGPDDGEYHVIRGSSWMDSSVSELRLTYRDYGNSPRPDVGFRIARYAE